jgi:chromatin segregation and condensation protein Rec8/ScpA/Scc1 (kleisin family)
MATALALRLKRLEAIRGAAERLFGRAQLDRDVFGRGQPEPIAHIKRPEWTATLYDLLTAYAQQRQRTALSHVRVAQRTVWSLAQALEALKPVQFYPGHSFASALPDAASVRVGCTASDFEIATNRIRPFFHA